MKQNEVPATQIFKKNKGKKNQGESKGCNTIHRRRVQ